MTDMRPLFLGVGVSIYDDGALQPLPKAVEDVETLAGYLDEQRGFQAEAVVDPTEEQAKAALKRHLKKGSMPTGSIAVLLWSGHGEPLPEGGLHLIARDTESGTDPELTANRLASYLARCGATQILLLLDTCFSGAGVLDAQHLMSAVKREGAVDKGWFGVLAACRDIERAQDGILVSRLIRLLQQGPMRLANQRHWSAHNEGVRGSDLIDALCSEWDDPDQHPDGLWSHGALPMFPNPRYDPDASEQIVEHLRLAAEGRAPDEEGVYFTGRLAPLARLVDWMQRDEPGVFVLTGPAGSGKSAIAGRLASLSNPVQRARLLRDRPLESADPGECSIAAQVHARRLTREQVVAEIDRQLVRRALLRPTAEGGDRGRGALLDALERLPAKPLILIDGLDEAGADAWSIAEDVIALLAGSSRILVATRPLPDRGEGRPDWRQILAPHHLLDLGDPALAASTRQDVTDYVLARLAPIAAPQMDGAKVAEAILALSTGTDEGAFLLAQVITSQLRAEPIDTSRPDWEHGLSRGIEEALERDLARLAEPRRARALLTALAWSYGRGLPDDLWPLVATALAPESPFADADIDWILGAAGRYIIEDGAGGRAVYRLSHQRLVTLLHPPIKPLELDAGFARAAPLAEALVERCRAHLAAGQSADAHQYLWNHLWQHCLDAGPSGLGTLLALADDNPAFRPALAGALNNLGIRYSEVGRRAEALAPTEEAVALYRALAADNPAFRPDLAMALNNLGIRYSELGRRAEALAPSEEAVALCRHLAAHNPAFLPNLARALNNLGNRYREVGRQAEALAPSEEAVALYRPLAVDTPAFRPDLAGALTNLGVRYRGVGRRTEALTTTEEAVALFLALAAENPSFRPDLASALNNLGIRFSEVGRRAEALAPSEEAVALCRHLAAANPAFRPDLARALNNLGVCYSQLGRRAEAPAVTEEALALYRALVADNPALRPDLAMALNNLGVRYSEVGRRAEALAPTEEAVVLCRALAADNPAFRPDLASALNNLGIRYSEVGRRAEALAPSEEAVALYRALAADNPAFRPNLASALINLGILYDALGRSTDIDQLWLDTLAETPTPAAQAYLLIRRAEYRPPGDLEAVADLLKAQHLLPAASPDLIQDFQEVCRARRALDQAGFDLAWTSQSGAEPPEWLSHEQESSGDNS